jgi:cytoskeleton protein RodZ
MSENVELQPDGVVDDSGMTLLSAGSMLRRAREAEGLQLSDLAISLKVPVKKLEALEADSFDLLPDAIFTRALASSLCRTLKIDAKLILERLPSADRPNLKTDESGINTPFRTHGQVSGFLFFRILPRPLVIALSMLGLVAFAMLLVSVPSFSELTASAMPDTSKSIFPLVVAEDVSNTGMSQSSKDSTQPKLLITANEVTSSSNSGSPSQVLLSAASAASADGVAGAPAFTGSAIGASEGLVDFTARGTTWIEVIDSKGVVQVRKTIQGGEVISASGAIPLTVVVGRADATAVQVRGKPFDLLNISKDNVARFEVK